MNIKVTLLIVLAVLPTHITATEAIIADIAVEVAKLRAVYNNHGSARELREMAMLEAYILAGDDSEAIAMLTADFRAIYKDPGNDWELRVAALIDLEKILEDKPDPVLAAEVVNELQSVYRKTENNWGLRRKAMHAAGSILQRNPNPVLAAKVIIELKNMYDAAFKDVAVEAEGRILLGNFNPEKAEEYLEERGRPMGVDPEVITALEKRLSARFAGMEVFARAWQKCHGNPTIQRDIHE